MSKYLKIDDRFSVGVDKYNWILHDKEKGDNRGLSYYGKLEHMTLSIVNRLRKDAIARGEVDLSEYLPFKQHSSQSVKALCKEIDVLLEGKLRKLKKGSE